MPQFFLDPHGEIDSKEVLDLTSPMQYVGRLVVPDELKKMKNGDLYIVKTEKNSHELYMVYSKGCEVDVGGYGIGKFLCSSGFGPCLAVVANLADGNCALFHVSDPFAQSPMFKEFIDDIVKRGVTSLTMFEKENVNPQRKEDFAGRAFILHDALQSALKEKHIHHVEVERFQVSNYYSIVADARSGKVFLTNSSLTTKVSPGEEEDFSLPISKKASLDSGGKESTKELIREQKKHANPRKKLMIKSLTSKPSVSLAKETKPPAVLKTHLILVKSPITNSNLQWIKNLIENEVGLLSTKSFLCFPAYHGKSKVKHIETALENAIHHFPDLTPDKIYQFLEFKKNDKSKSIKEALEISRYGRGKSSMYKVLCKKMEASLLVLAQSSESKYRT